jgi:hypothetical protein
LNEVNDKINFDIFPNYWLSFSWSWYQKFLSNLRRKF